MQADPTLAQRILDTALELGEQRGWDAVHLRDVAAAMDITLADIQQRYPHKDALAEAWFDRAESTMVASANTPDWLELSPRDRLFRAIWSWLDALGAHKAVTAAMLRYKLQPDHIHLQVQGLLRVSRTVQWIRETAALPDAGWRRELQEIALTGIYLATVARWLNDDSPDSTATRSMLDRVLANAERAVLRTDFPGSHGGGGKADPGSWTS